MDNYQLRRHVEDDHGIGELDGYGYYSIETLADIHNEDHDDEWWPRLPSQASAKLNILRHKHKELK